MVAKAKRVLNVSKRGASKKEAPLKKIRIGVIVGKDFDPVKQGSQWPNFPQKLVLTSHDWGKYSIDACTALRMQQLHPDILDIDIIQGREMTEKRLQKNHVNLNFWYDVGVACMSGNKKHIDEVVKCHRNPECRLDPSWDYYQWVVDKTIYMQQLQRAGIPLIPTVFYKNGFDPKECMRDVQRMGWDKFFVKVGSYTFFGAGAVHGKTEDFLGKRAKDLDKFAEQNSKSKVFLLQPYTLKPNGEVFDEVRNFFIDGQWRYSVFTHGTDETDAGYYEEPEGPRKAACKALAEKAYQQVLKAATWQGKRQTPLLNRIDIGVVPKKGADSLHKTDNTYFVNEVELIMTTWLDRYSPISVQDVMAHAATKHALELLVGMQKARRRMPDEADVRRLVGILSSRLSPFGQGKVKA